jgi:hypothetical protein
VEWLKVQALSSNFSTAKKKKKRKKNLKIDCGLLTLIILATQEVEIRRIAVQGQPGQIV